MNAHTSEVLVTGASGFVGRRVCENLDRCGFSVVAVSRKSVRSVGEINARTQWGSVLRPNTTVVHLAARAHVLDRRDANDLAAFRAINVAGTRRLASDAAEIGVRRLVFVSSVGVLGNNTDNRGPFTSDDSPDPRDAYAVSKYEAEIELLEVSRRTGMEVCILRPTLVYGPNAPGNFQRLLRWVDRGIPLPLGGVRNARSLIAVDNLADLIRVCIVHPSAAGKTFLASDGGSISTPELITVIAHAMGRRPRLIPVSVQMLRLAGKVFGKTAEVDRLVGSLEVDIADTCETLAWAPPLTLREALRRTVAA